MPPKKRSRSVVSNSSDEPLTNVATAGGSGKDAAVPPSTLFKVTVAPGDDVQTEPTNLDKPAQKVGNVVDLKGEDPNTKLSATGDDQGTVTGKSSQKAQRPRASLPAAIPSKSALAAPTQKGTTTGKGKERAKDPETPIAPRTSGHQLRQTPQMPLDATIYHKGQLVIVHSISVQYFAIGDPHVHSTMMPIAYADFNLALASARSVVSSGTRLFGRALYIYREEGAGFVLVEQITGVNNGPKEVIEAKILVTRVML